MDPAAKRAIASIHDNAWTTIKYTDAILGQATGAWISKAQVAEVPFTAFTSKKTTDQTATIRRKLITVPARISSSARRLHLHLPRAWPWEMAWSAP